MKLSGTVLMIAAQIAFTIMVVFVKEARQEMDTFQVALWRSVTAVPILLLLCWKGSWKIHNKTFLLLRIGMGFGALCCFFGAAKGLSIADLSLISKIQPMLVAVLAPLLLGMTEKASSRLWGLMLLALVGCSILLAPSLQIGSLYGLLAVAASCFSAVAHVCLRKLQNERSVLVVFWFQMGSGLLASVCCLAQMGSIPLPPSHLWGALLGIGLMATVGQLLMTAAYQKEKAAVVAVASYAGPVFAVLADVIAFDLFPTWNGYLGGAIVIVAGMLLVNNSHGKDEM